jgi:hypothetical protein
LQLCGCAEAKRLPTFGRRSCGVEIRKSVV